MAEAKPFPCCSWRVVSADGIFHSPGLVDVVACRPGVTVLHPGSEDPPGSQLPCLYVGVNDGIAHVPGIHVSSALRAVCAAT